MQKKPFSYAEFEQIYSKVPRLCIDLLIMTEQGYVLSKRAAFSYKDQWHLPGGTLYYKETVEDAIKRIALDETGLTVNPKKLLTHIEYFSEEKERGFGYSVGLVFSCEKTGGLLQLHDEISDIQYFSSPPQDTVREQYTFLQNLSTLK